MARGRRVSASQVGQYAYCAQAWWLREIEKHTPADLGAFARGTRAHERHGWRVALALTFRQVAILMLVAAAVALIAWAALSFL